MFRLLVKNALVGLVISLATGCSGGGSSQSGIPTVQAESRQGGPVTALPSSTAVKSSAVKKASVAVVGLSDNFSGDAVGGPAVGWNVVSGTWSVCQNGTLHGYCQTSTNAGVSLNGATWWSDYTVDSQITDTNTAFGGAGVIGRAISTSQYYLLELRPQINGSLPYWYLLKKSSGPSIVLASGLLQAPDNNPSFGLRLSFAGSQITASIAFGGGTTYQVLGTATDSSYATGQVGAYTWVSGARSFQSILVTLASAPLPAESAVSSSSFIDSLGMNGHFESSNYSGNMAQEHSLVANLGVRHYRVSADQILNPGGAVPYASNLASLYTLYGTKFDVLSSISLPAADVIKAISLLPAGSVDSVEGPNEADSPSQGNAYDANFAVDIPAYMKLLYPAIKSTPATAQLTVIGPAFANYASYGAVGNISSYVDYGNMHDYMSGFNPGTTGWGGGGFSFAPSLFYGSILWNMAAAGQATPAKPVMATETGYSTAPIHTGIPFDVQAKYIPRLYLESFRQNVPRTFLYQLIGYNTTTADGSLYIVSPTGVPTPAYNALQGMIAALSDGGIKGSPITYNWGLTGQAANVDHLLMHKADGTLIIPLWIEVPSFDVNANGGIGAELTVPPQTVTVNVLPTLHTAVILTCNPATGAWTSQPVAITNGTLTMSVTDTVSILEVNPT